jgi:hypothetical protein
MGASNLFQGLMSDRATEQNIMEIGSINGSEEVLNSVIIPKLWGCSRQRTGSLPMCLI